MRNRISLPQTCPSVIFPVSRGWYYPPLHLPNAEIQESSLILPCSSLSTSNPSHSSHFSSKLYFNSILISKGIATIPAPFTWIFYFRTGLSPSNVAPNHCVPHTEACLLKHSSDVSSPFNLFSAFLWKWAQGPTLCRGWPPATPLPVLKRI